MGTGYMATLRPGLSSGYSANVTLDNEATIPITVRLWVGSGGVLYVDMAGNGGATATATGTITIPAVDPVGNSGATIAGVAVAVPWVTDDDTTASDLADAINAESGLDGIVTAEATAAVVTLTPVVAGKFGNAITLTDAVNSTLSGSGTLSGGAGGDGNYTAYTAQSGDYLWIAVDRIYELGSTASNIKREW